MADQVRIPRADGNGSKLMSVGQVVSFKSDVEQCGRITKIIPNRFGGGYDVVLEALSDEGFYGGYIGGCSTTMESAADCWVED